MDAVAMATVRYYAQAVLFGMASIAFYRGAWLLMDMYLFPASPLLSALVSMLAGFVFFVLFDNSLI